MKVENWNSTWANEVDPFIFKVMLKRTTCIYIENEIENEAEKN